MKSLVDVHFPLAEIIRVVIDNLNIHTPAALYETFEAKEARRILKKLEFHYTPKHGSWLNQVEIELSVLSRQCLERRIPDQETLKQEITAWEESRNQARATVAFWQSSWLTLGLLMHNFFGLQRIKQLHTSVQIVFQLATRPSAISFFPLSKDSINPGMSMSSWVASSLSLSAR
jgi:transposase